MRLPTFKGLALQTRYSPAAGRRKFTVLPWVTQIFPWAMRLWPPMESAKATSTPPWTVPYCWRLLLRIIIMPSAPSSSVRMRWMPFSTAQGSRPRISPNWGSCLKYSHPSFLNSSEEAT